ncbi:uncharacterized protein METZ01_LOCUS214632 [marine metagenome]|uniref:Uncharacterized protein n=1 Tax=marine metagenome TaxID=408172 RepID=A0A382FFB9_9ZZZZ
MVLVEAANSLRVTWSRFCTDLNHKNQKILSSGHRQAMMLQFGS